MQLFYRELWAESAIGPFDMAKIPALRLSTATQEFRISLTRVAIGQLFERPGAESRCKLPAYAAAH